jgi:hypothetical protein
MCCSFRAVKTLLEREAFNRQQTMEFTDAIRSADGAADATGQSFESSVLKVSLQIEEMNWCGHSRLCEVRSGCCADFQLN